MSEADLELAARMSRMEAAKLKPRQPRGIVTVAPSSRRVVSTGRALKGDVLQSRSTDDEASALLDELGKLQTLMTLQMHYGPVWVAAADLVQRTRILIIERCKR